MNTRVKPDGDFAAQQAGRMRELLHQRGTLPRDDLEYLVIAIDKLRDERLKSCIAELIGWSDDDRAEIETFVAIAIEVMKKTNVSKLRDAARIVELRYLVQNIEGEKGNAAK
ncbi:hypothetical protein [Polynucleobacter sp. UK-Kesae-W10]|uniref:hypothetical protein n=1 Tax=Polynucleobacter sp. UK-Kesae-W10 TaxID=1819738 RepID=UPI001C0C8F53|nr:hypothetical protein [Polynucleobacter sp. UK-Kesae-W10]MBU3577511.1 hypothetical protein [Polynucleobacter sp. UK-Kesae-W10]